MVFTSQLLFISLAIAEAMLMWTWAEQVPSLYRVAPRYLKLVTCFSFWPCMLISAVMLFMLLVLILLFSVLTSIPYAIALSTSLLVRSWSSPLLPPVRSMLSASRRLHIGLPPMEMDVWWSRSVCAWSFLGISWTGWVRISIPDGHLLSSWRPPVADWSRGLHCWSSHIWCPNGLNQSFHYVEASEDLLQASMPDSVRRLPWSLWSCGTDCAGFVGVCLWWLDCWRSVLLCCNRV